MLHTLMLHTLMLHALMPGALVIGLAVMISGCAPTPVSVRLDNTLSIIVPRHDFVTREFATHWTLIGEHGATRPVVRNNENGLFLEIPGGPTRFAALRPLDAQLLATPFLAWRWRLSPTPPGPSPIQLTIGFLDGDAPGSTFSLRSIIGRPIPNFSRSLAITWGKSALQRGTLDVRPRSDNAKPLARYYARGGRENLGQWWSEAIDLSALHSKAWPHMDMSKTRIVFAGLVMMADTVGSRADLAEYRLSR